MNTVLLIDNESYQELIQRIEQIDRRISEIQSEKPVDRWLTNKEVSEMLSVTGRTLQNYRDSGKLSFSQVGAKIYYRKGDIENFLQTHYQGFNRADNSKRVSGLVGMQSRKLTATDSPYNQKGGKQDE